MNKLIKGIAIVAVALGVGSTAGVTNASAKVKYTTTPTSLRGTWYQKATNFRGYDRLTITKYAFKSVLSKQGATSILSGTKPGYRGSKHSDLQVIKKNSHGYYWIGEYGTDDGIFWKRTTHKFQGKNYAVLRTLTLKSMTLPRKYEVSYWTHYKVNMR